MRRAGNAVGSPSTDKSDKAIADSGAAKLVGGACEYGVPGSGVFCAKAATVALDAFISLTGIDLSGGSFTLVVPDWLRQLPPPDMTNGVCGKVSHGAWDLASEPNQLAQNIYLGAAQKIYADSGATVFLSGLEEAQSFLSNSLVNLNETFAAGNASDALWSYALARCSAEIAASDPVALSVLASAGQAPLPPDAPAGPGAASSSVSPLVLAAGLGIAGLLARHFIIRKKR